MDLAFRVLFHRFQTVFDCINRYTAILNKSISQRTMGGKGGIISKMASLDRVKIGKMQKMKKIILKAGE